MQAQLASSRWYGNHLSVGSAAALYPVLGFGLGLLVLIIGFAVPWRTVQDVGAHSPLIAGLYPAEQTPDFTYAYTTADTVVQLPELGVGSSLLTLRAGGPATVVPRDVWLQLGTAMYPLGEVRSMRHYQLLLPAQASGDVQIRLASSTGQVGTDPRQLGILLDYITVDTVSGMRVPGSAWTGLLIVCLGAWLTMVQLRQLARWRGPLLLAVSLGAATLYLVERGAHTVQSWWYLCLFGGLALAPPLTRGVRTAWPVVGPGIQHAGAWLQRQVAQALRAVDHLRLARPWLWSTLVFGGAGLLVFSRRPDALLNAQLWAEDGAIWYFSAYTTGPLKPLLVPHTGYYQTLPRLVAAASLSLPLRWVPLLFNVVAIAIQSLPPLLLLSSRYDRTIPRLDARLLLALAYLAVPNPETHANLTNAQWNLALVVIMIVLAEPSPRWGWRSFDFVVLAIAAVSGPFSLILAPIALISAYAERRRWLMVLGLVLSAGAAIQLSAYLFQTTAPRINGRVPLGATPTLFGQIVGGQVFAQAVLGSTAFSRLSTQPVWQVFGASVVTLAGLGMTAYALWKGPLKLRLLILFAAWIMLGALISPMASLTIPQWASLAMAGSGFRYWRIPVLTIVLVLGYLAFTARPWPLRGAAILLLLTMTVGSLYDWRYAPWPDLRWPAHAAAFEAAPPGATVTMPIHPNGWHLEISKR